MRPRTIAAAALLWLAACATASAESKYTPTREEWLEVSLRSYVNGFKEFDTAVHVRGGVSVVVYYDPETQDRLKAQQLADRLRAHAEAVLKKYPWAKAYKVTAIVQAPQEDHD